MTPQPPLFESDLPSLQRLGRGKVRDLYRVDADHLLIVVTDRLSAFDVVLPDPIPDKGAVLTRLAAFWFARSANLVQNHLTGIAPADVVRGAAERAQVDGRAIVVRRCRPLPIEAVVRGYLIGSGWKDYQRDGRVCGIELPPGLALAARLPEPIFTPATKAEQGAHDENIGYAEVARLVGEPLAAQVRDLALAIYRQAADYAAGRGIIIADTKMEFGLDDDNRLVLIDELLTPDSSRFWPADAWRPGANPPSFDKQYVRDYLETLDWNKQAPGPALPPDVIEKTAEKYREAERRLVGSGS